jgi:hypothetical protein
MKDEGKYLQLWTKYSPVIKLLLKRTDSEDQKLQLYKHEFENGGVLDKTGYSFNIEILAGKVTKTSSRKAVAHDLVNILENNLDIKNWLKEHRVRFVMGKSFELQIQKVPPIE